MPAARPAVLQPIAFPYLNTSEISSLAFSPDGKRVAFGYGTDAEVTLWNLETGKLAWQRHVNASSGGPIVFDPHGQFLAAQFDDPDCDEPVIVSTVRGRLVRTFFASREADPARIESAGRFLVVSGFQEGVVSGNRQANAVPATEVWDTRLWRRVDRLPQVLHGFVPLTPKGKIIRRPLPSPAWVPASLASAYIQANTDYLAGAQDDSKGNGSVEVWSRHTHQRLWQTSLHNFASRAVAISPDGNTLAVPTLQGSVYLWNIQTGHLIAKTQCSRDVLRCLAFSPNGQVLAVAGGMEYPIRSDVVGWNLSDGVRLLDMSTHKVFAVLKAAFPPEENETNRADWSLDHPEWFAALPGLSYLASSGVIKQIRTPGRARNAKIIARYDRPERVRSALRKCRQVGR